MRHYEEIGINEGRSSFPEEIMYQKEFYKKYPEFVWNFYNIFYTDLSVYNGVKYLLMKHYENTGKQEGRISNEKEFYERNHEFDYDFYKNYNLDLSSLYKENKYLYMRHYEYTGKQEGRMIHKYFPNYSFLFHKYILNLVDKNNIHLNYTPKHISNLIKTKICHIHCFKISFLDSMFETYIATINQFFDIIVTFHLEDNLNIIQKYKYITFINCENKGYDVGPKFIVYDYLKKMNYNYDYIFYIHSKSRGDKRNEYLMPFIGNIQGLDDLLNKKEVGGVFNDIIYCGNQILFKHNDLLKIDINNLHWGNNDVYMNELLHYFNIIQDYPEYYLGKAEKIALCRCPQTGKESWNNGKILLIAEPIKNMIVKAQLKIKDTIYEKDFIFVKWETENFYEWRMKSGNILQLRQQYIDGLNHKDKKYLRMHT
jgi:hypothetical protein